MVKIERVGGFFSCRTGVSGFCLGGIKDVFSFLGQALAERTASVICLGPSLLFYLLGKAV